jgi:hypothetical protein
VTKRGPKPKTGTTRKVLIALRVTAQERAAWKRAAEPQTLADWIREQCNRASR